MPQIVAAQNVTTSLSTVKPNPYKLNRCRGNRYMLKVLITRVLTLQESRRAKLLQDRAWTSWIDS